MELWLNMLIGSATQGYGAWLTTTLFLVVVICGFATILGQDWWSRGMQIWVRYALLGPLTASWWMIRTLWSVIRPRQRGAGNQRGGNRHGNRTFNITLIQIGGRDRRDRRRPRGRRR